MQSPLPPSASLPFRRTFFLDDHLSRRLCRGHHTELNISLRIAVNYPHPKPGPRCSLASDCSPVYPEFIGQFWLPSMGWHNAYVENKGAENKGAGSYTVCSCSDVPGAPHGLVCESSHRSGATLTSPQQEIAALSVAFSVLQAFRWKLLALYLCIPFHRLTLPATLALFSHSCPPQLPFSLLPSYIIPFPICPPPHPAPVPVLWAACSLSPSHATAGAVPPSAPNPWVVV